MGMKFSKTVLISHSPLNNYMFDLVQLLKKDRKLTTVGVYSCVC